MKSRQIRYLTSSFLSFFALAIIFSYRYTKCIAQEGGTTVRPTASLPHRSPALATCFLTFEEGRVPLLLRISELALQWEAVHPTPLHEPARLPCIDYTHYFRKLSVQMIEVCYQYISQPWNQRCSRPGLSATTGSFCTNPIGCP